MSALVLSDLQLDDNPRNLYRHQFMRDLPKVLSKLSAVDQIIILGDLTEEKDRHSAWLVNSIVDYIVTLSDWAKVYILLGNHDYVDVDEPFFAFLKHLHNVEFITEPLRIQLSGIGLSLFLPHTRNYKRDWKPEIFDFEYKAHDGKTYSYTPLVFAHQTFAGAQGGGGRALEGVPLTALPEGIKVISGDVHIPQQHKQVTYVGAPYTVDFGDDYEPRMLLLSSKGKGMQVDRMEVKSILCTGAQKRLVEINTTGKLAKQLREYRAGDILKVRVRLLPEDVPHWQQMQRDIRKQAEGMRFIVDAILPVMEQVEGKRLRVTADQPKDDRQIVTAFAKQREVDNRTLETGYLLMEKTK